MPFQEGNQYGKTSKRGEGNVTRAVKEKLKGLLVDTLESINLATLSKTEKLRLIEISLRYTLPKKIVEQEAMPTDFQIQIVQDIDQYSNKELQDILKKRK